MIAEDIDLWNFDGNYYAGKGQIILTLQPVYQTDQENRGYPITAKNYQMPYFKIFDLGQIFDLINMLLFWH